MTTAPATTTTTGTPVEPSTATPRRVFSPELSPTGLLVAGIFYTLSLFPSLLPRTSLTQGIISGVTIVIGYGMGAAVHWAWDYVGLPRTRGRVRKVVIWTLVGIIGFMIVSATWQHVGWQNDVRELMGMEPTSPTLWPMLAVTALLVAALLLVIGRSIRLLFTTIVAWLARRMTGRQARLVGWIVMLTLAWGLWSGVLVNGFFTAANQIFAPRDSATDEGVVAPTSSLRSGSPDSLVAWDTLGRQGRNFVAGGPTVAELDGFHGGGAVEPIRVYAGLKSADTNEERADLVLAELQRTGAFDRSTLLIATTTGTGFLDADGVDPLEWVTNGDTAIVGVQYSYLPSWISLLADQQEVRDTSRAVFDRIHEHWRTLPEDDRPDIYLYGLSLGSFGVEAILDSINIVNEPIDGVLMVGPPFVNELHERLEQSRDEGSSASLPVVDDGRTVRFMNQFSDPLDDEAGSATWGDTRLLYLQHASDPVVNFSTNLAFDEPDWLEPGPRGPEVADSMVWTPLVTMWQVLVDLPAAGSTPEGYAHLYDKPSNARAWAAVVEPDLTPERLADLEALLATFPPD
ncbi:alpha/beta hydrolase [Salsipaludibacter albus]|uniref:alpha/beta hydrolase n=1 Tax=Salsipaludibacter albus TaxID=2849650 RepID=UPI001EE4C052|nr:alpha/beta-hydrolase family protein [Salsipaludibacter albus]MBY5161409.1 alpha/beta-hydrolase family protein [Salsipaludibacter albus]